MAAPALGPASAGKPRHVYTQEIAAMVYVHTAVPDPDPALVRYLEDAVRAEMAQLVTTARALAARRTSTSTGTGTVSVTTTASNPAAVAVDDLVFLVRHDPAKRDRLRSYLSWRDVRRKLKEPNEADAPDDLDALEEPVSDRTLKVLQNTVRLPWELADLYADHLALAAHPAPGPGPAADDPEYGDGDNDHEAAAYEVNKQRLRHADLLTRAMTRDEYELYAQARQASFVYRKSKKFRDFLALPALLDTVAPVSDEVMDVLGFLAYECVRALCDAGLAQRRAGLEAQRRREIREGKKRAREGDEDRDAGEVAEGVEGDGEEDGGGAAPEEGEEEEDAKDADEKSGSSANSKGKNEKKRRTATSAGDPSEAAAPSSKKKKRPPPQQQQSRAGAQPPQPPPPPRKGLEASTTTSSATATGTGPGSSPTRRRPLEVPTSLFSAPLTTSTSTSTTLSSSSSGETAAGPPNASPENGAGVEGAGGDGGGALSLQDVAHGYHAVLHAQGALKMAGLRNWRGGVVRRSNRLL